jgi:outer membrane protein
VQITLPLFQGGGPSAQVRQAQARSSQAIEQTIEAERSVIAQTRTAYASWRASNANIASSETAVAATALSLEGVRAENSVGTRSILDILNAEQEYLDAQVQLVTARRNAYVAGFSLLAAMGQAEARDLGLDGGVLYDPEVNYKRVRNRIWDWDTDPKPTPVATRTVDTPAQSPAVRSELGATGK